MAWEVCWRGNIPDLLAVDMEGVEPSTNGL